MLQLKMIFAILIGLTACTPYTPDVVGEWVQPISGQPNQEQGISFKNNGKASSINMHTLVYTHWKQEGDTLQLTGVSKGNHQDISFTQEYSIEKITSDILILKDGETTLIYQRKKEK